MPPTPAMSSTLLLGVRRSSSIGVMRSESRMVVIECLSAGLDDHSTPTGAARSLRVPCPGLVVNQPHSANAKERGTRRRFDNAKWTRSAKTRFTPPMRLPNENQSAPVQFWWDIYWPAFPFQVAITLHIATEKFAYLVARIKHRTRPSSWTGERIGGMNFVARCEDRTQCELHRSSQAPSATFGKEAWNRGR